MPCCTALMPGISSPFGPRAHGKHKFGVSAVATLAQSVGIRLTTEVILLAFLGGTTSRRSLRIARWFDLRVGALAVWHQPGEMKGQECLSLSLIRSLLLTLRQ